MNVPFWGEWEKLPNFHQSLLEQLKISIVTRQPESFFLVYEQDRFMLKTQEDAQGVMVDFSYYEKKYQKRPTKGNDLLVKAVAPRDQDALIVDGTLGLCEDSFRLLWAGYSVLGFEESPSVYALVASAVHVDSKKYEFLKQLTMVYGDVRSELQAQDPNWSVVYLDVMFEHKKKALPKKNMQYLAQITKPADSQWEELAQRVKQQGASLVIKRPGKGAPLMDTQPKAVISGKAIRYDRYY